MKNVLIATDFSLCSKNAIQGALKFIKESQTPCKVIFLNTYLIPSNTPDEFVIEENDRIKITSQSELLEVKNQFMRELENQHVEVETTLRMGTLQGVISQMISKEKIDYVVMGKDGGRHVEEVSELLKKSQDIAQLMTFA